MCFKNKNKNKNKNLNKKGEKLKYMITCVNALCKNNNLELEDSTEVCPLCGDKTEKTAIVKGNSSSATTLGAIAAIAALAGFIIFFSRNLYIGFTLAIASIILGFVSKIKFAAIITILFLLLDFGVIILFLDPFGWL